MINLFFSSLILFSIILCIFTACSGVYAVLQLEKSNNLHKNRLLYTAITFTTITSLFFIPLIAEFQLNMGWEGLGYLHSAAWMVYHLMHNVGLIAFHLYAANMFSSRDSWLRKYITSS